MAASIQLSGFCFLRNVLQLLEIAAAACSLLVRYQVIQRYEGNGNSENCSADSLPPRRRKLYTCDLRKDVNPDRGNANLVGYLTACECLRTDLVSFKRSTELLECLEYPRRILC